jgi:hypothetical protein
LAALSILLTIPSIGIAVIAPMAGADGTIEGMAMALLLFFGPAFLVGAAVIGIACYRRYSRAKLLTTILLFGLAAGPYTMLAQG